MKKVLIATGIALVLIALGIVFAPARLASNALENTFPRAPFGKSALLQDQRTATTPEIRLLGTTGTLWNGAGQLLVNRRPIGDLSWQIQPARLLALEAVVDWQLSAEQFKAQGTAAARGEEFDLRAVKANLSEEFLRANLGRYDIAPSGDLTIDNLDITNLKLNKQQNWPSQVTASGDARWAGGRVRYRLAGQSYDIELPPMLGTINSPMDGVQNPGWPQLTVTSAEDAMLLITGRLTPSGSAAIGITSGFTRLAGQPWPGSEPDHAVVLEVEEQLH